VPSTLAASLRNIMTLGERQAKEGNKATIIGNVQKLIRSLTPPDVKQNPPPTNTAIPDKNNQTSTDKAKEEARTTTLPARPAADNSGSRRMNMPPRPRTDRDAQSAQSTPGTSIRGVPRTTSAGPSTTSNTRDIIDDDSPRSQKKVKKSSGSTDYAPSLLSRLAATNGSAAQSTAGMPPKRRTDNTLPAVVQTERSHDSMDQNETPAGGFSIRGAANRIQDSSLMSVSRTSSSLLERMDSPTGGDRGSWKKRKRGGIW